MENKRIFASGEVGGWVGKMREQKWEIYKRGRESTCPRDRSQGTLRIQPKLPFKRGTPHSIYSPLPPELKCGTVRGCFFRNSLVHVLNYINVLVKAF